MYLLLMREVLDDFLKDMHSFRPPLIRLFGVNVAVCITPSQNCHLHLIILNYELCDCASLIHKRVLVFTDVTIYFTILSQFVKVMLMHVVM